MRESEFGQYGVPEAGRRNKDDRNDKDNPTEEQPTEEQHRRFKDHDCDFSIPLGPMTQGGKILGYVYECSICHTTKTELV